MQAVVQRDSTVNFDADPAWHDRQADFNPPSVTKDLTYDALWLTIRIGPRSAEPHYETISVLP
jgi:hypothetical protein